MQSNDPRLIALVMTQTIRRELQRQFDAGGAYYANDERHSDLVDGEIDVDGIAAAVYAALRECLLID